MTCSRIKSVMKPTLLILCGLVLSLAASRPTVAKSPADSVKDATTVRNSSAADINANAAKRSLPRITHSKAKRISTLSKSLSKTCGCPVSAEEFSGFASCMKKCLKDAGVNLVTLATCAGACGGGNFIACAICAGVQEWVVLGCGQYCAWYQVFSYAEASMRPSKNRRLQQRKLSPQRAALAT